MDIYLLICTPEYNMQQISVHRVMRCISTTVDQVSAKYEEYMREYYTRNTQSINLYPLIISRPADVRVLETMAEGGINGGSSGA